jgi:isopentenyldiphosphate isomerase
MTHITFVDENDNVIGSGTKQEVWTKGIWHRIVRLYIVNAQGEMLITKRSQNLASLAGRWDQSAAGHVDEGESYAVAASRELEEEVGIHGVELKELFRTQHIDTDETDKIKKRFSMNYLGHYDGEVLMNPEEVSETRWVQPGELEAWMKATPSDFTEGFLFNFMELRKRNVL